MMATPPTRPIRAAIRSVLKKVGVGVARYGELEELRSRIKSMEANPVGSDVEFLRDIYPLEAKGIDLVSLHKAIWCLPDSKSQYRQDIFVLTQLNFKRGGFFVEFVA